MRALLHIIVLVGVLWCGLHGSLSPAGAFHVDAVALTAGEPPADSSDGDDEQAVHTAHHHCPSIGGRAAPVPACNLAPDGPAPVAGAVRPLASRALAPPVEPPAA